MTRIFLLYSLSGFVSLGYQVGWFRILTDWFGSTNLTFALVVCNFIGGLGAGALLSRGIANWIVRRLHLRDPLRVYGVLELLVGTSALLTVLADAVPADTWGSFPYHLSQGIWVQSMSYRASQWVVAAACVFLPCVFMGVTFPLLCHTFRGVPGGGRFPAALYAWNTLGACTGVLACQFLLLPWLGHELMFWLMAGLNIGLGAYFLATGGAPKTSAPPVLSMQSAEPGASGIEPRSGSFSVLLAFAVLGGLLSGALEGDLFKRISFAIPLNPGAAMSFVSFWAILAIFLASTGVHRLPRLRLLHIKILFVLALVYSVVIWHFLDGIMDWAQNQFLSRPIEVHTTIEGALNAAVFPSNLLQLLLFVGICVFPPYLFISLLLPYACNRVQHQGRHLGLAYGLNTLAFCAGMIAFTLIAPRVNIFYSLKLFFLVFALGIVQLLLLAEGRRVSVWKSLGVLVALVVACIVTPSDFDRGYFRPTSLAASQPIRALKSNAAHTTFVVGDSDEGLLLQFGRLEMSGNNHASKSYMGLMAHFPLLIHPRPEKALLICLGAGNTAAAIAAHDSVRQIDVVDLNERVFETAPIFSASNDDVHLDPRVRFIHDDGRHFLDVTHETYDLITSEPPPPLAAGVYRLYAREYYEAVQRHLTPEGLMTQWLPVYQLPPEAVDLIVRTFVDVFPHTLLFTGYGTNFILVGSPSKIDLKRIEERFFASEAVVEHLERIYVHGPVDLLARIVEMDDGLRRRYEASRLISDQHNDLEDIFVGPHDRVVVPYDPKRILAEMEIGGLLPHEELEGVMLHLGRLRYRARGFPFESLATVAGTDGSDIPLANADWSEIARMFEEHLWALGAGHRDHATRLAQRSLALGAEQPELLLRVAMIELVSGRPETAIPWFRKFQRLEPEDPMGSAFLGQALQQVGLADEALAQFRETAQRKPNWYSLYNNMAWILATHPDPSRRDPLESIRLAERAAELTDHRRAEVLDTLAAAYAASGQFDRAIAIARSAITLSGEAETDRDPMARRLKLYRDGRSVVDHSLVPSDP